MADELPPDPLAGMNEQAAGLHEVFESLTHAGFTEWQACRIIGVVLAENGRQQ